MQSERTETRFEVADDGTIFRLTRLVVTNSAGQQFGGDWHRESFAPGDPLPEEPESPLDGLVDIFHTTPAIEAYRAKVQAAADAITKEA